jgi:plastocyanin
MRKQGIVVLALMSIVLAACGDDGGAEPSEVTFNISAIEIKGSTNGIEAPSVDPATLSNGYGFDPPGEYSADDPTRWQVESYLYSPGAMAATQGDDITLRFFGVNGDEHVMFVQAPDGSQVGDTVTLNRGRELAVEFTADQLGHYQIICSTHAPTMTADLYVTG